MLHLKGLSPVWERKWIWRALSLPKVFPQYLHLCLHNESPFFVSGGRDSIFDFTFLEDSIPAWIPLNVPGKPMMPGDCGRSAGKRLARSGIPFKMSVLEVIEPSPPGREAGMPLGRGSLPCFIVSIERFSLPVLFPISAAAADSCWERCAPRAFRGSITAPTDDWRPCGVIMATWILICSVSWICCSCCCWRHTNCSKIIGMASMVSCDEVRDFLLFEECWETATLVSAMASSVTFESWSLDKGWKVISGLSSWSCWPMSSVFMLESSSALTFDSEWLLDWLSSWSLMRPSGEPCEYSSGTSLPSPSFMMTTFWLLVQFFSCSRNSASSKNSAQHLLQILVSSIRNLFISFPASSAWSSRRIPKMRGYRV